MVGVGSEFLFYCVYDCVVVHISIERCDICSDKEGVNGNGLLVNFANKIIGVLNVRWMLVGQGSQIVIYESGELVGG